MTIQNEMRKPIVAIIGRQNVGKSTLLNRLAGKRIAIVEDLPGTTRDRVFADVLWQDKTFTLVDTGGLEIELTDEISKGVEKQVTAAITSADLVIFMVDVKDGIMPADQEIASLLRKARKPIILVVNKVDNDRLEMEVPEFYQLGLGEPFSISAHHARGTGDFLDKIVSKLPELPLLVTGPNMLKIAIVGRPNVGKSMLLNTLLGEERSIVSDVPGTTRDATDTTLDFEGEPVVLIDTAGIRRRGQIESGVEKYSVLRSLLAIERCDVALLVMDATEIVTAQDLHVGGYIYNAAKGIVLLVNKWDLIPEKNVQDWITGLKSNFKFADYAPVLFISALTGEGVGEVIPTANKVYEQRMKRIPDEEVRRVIRQAIAEHNIPRKGRLTLAVNKITQSGVNPPEFTFKVNDSRLIHFSYKRYLENQLRKEFGFEGTAIRLVFSSGGEF